MMRPIVAADKRLPPGFQSSGHLRYARAPGVPYRKFIRCGFGAVLSGGRKSEGGMGVMNEERQIKFYTDLMAG